MLLFLKPNFRNNMLVKRKVWKIWKKHHYTSTISTTNLMVNCKQENVGGLYKYACIVPYKNDNILSLEKIYDEKYNHVFSENNIEIESNLMYMYKLLLNSRSIEQIRLQVHNSYCAYENNFINDVKGINWSAYIPFSSVLVEPQISVKSIKSRLYHTCMIKNIILSVIKKQQQVYIEKNGDENILLKKKKLNPSTLQPLKIHVLFRYNELKISINISNDMNKRIYVLYKNQHSLKSTIIASAIFKINIFNYINSGKNLYVIDPFCNDGGILFETLSILMSSPNGSPSIKYPITSFPLHSPSTFYEVLNEVSLTPQKNINHVYFLGIDENKDHIKQANENLKIFFETMPRSVNEENGENEKLDHISRNYLDKSIPNGKILDEKLKLKDRWKNGTEDNSKEEKKNLLFEIQKKKVNDFYTLSSHELRELFFADEKGGKNSICNSLVERNIKFYYLNFLRLHNVCENCIIITNILNQEKNKIKKFEKILLRSQILNAFVFAQEIYKEKTKLKFKILLRFVSNGQNVIFMQLFGKTRTGVYDEFGDE
ncbi:hypothetical protein, conserved [Plasmodium gonderi]|uniref:Uncharacterized protein n=1 Tax=Plasmodium gonderi TaxID=77519 RepID=A0A1Y1JHP6_PLAGO|nr:hypothetical protein, conserved [Plasmodium gonderi]GAW79963.1 hypothetical protein, conserved [Plasmodium gonderi]